MLKQGLPGDPGRPGSPGDEGLEGLKGLRGKLGPPGQKGSKVSLTVGHLLCTELSICFCELLTVSNRAHMAIKVHLVILDFMAFKYA